VRSSITRVLYEQARVARRARSTDLVHLCDARPLLLSHAPFLITVHDVTFAEHPDWMPRHAALYKSAMLRTAVLRRPRAIVCDSQHTRERLLICLPMARRIRIEVVYLGVDPPPESATWQPEQTEPYFLTLSTVEPRKNHMTLLAAFRYLRRSGFPLRWKIAGSAGHLSAPIVAALRAEEGVDVMNYVSHDERERLLAGATFFALPSLEEGFGFPVVEAMIRGVPTACSTGSALDEVAGDDAVRVSATDRKGWVEALSALSSNVSLRQRLSTSGRLRAQRFSWQSTAQQLVSLYDDIRREMR
jgi:glycosyltransferase involved in cell wall biosynthesis